MSQVTVPLIHWNIESRCWLEILPTVAGALRIVADHAAIPVWSERNLSPNRIPLDLSFWPASLKLDRST